MKFLLKNKLFETILLLCCSGALCYGYEEKSVISTIEYFVKLAHDLSKSGVIYPGTKWCGSGNKAANYSDLGPERETDKCCQAHDMCHDIIEGGQTKHGLYNPRPYTSLECTCDQKFYDCLKSANTNTAKKVGQLYFTILGDLGSQCFKLHYPNVCNKSELTIRGNRCLEYNYDKKGPKKYQWFDLPIF